jgi:ubiquinone biosynthesis protein COQ4
MASAPFRPLEALRALQKLIQDPTKTEEAFRVVRSLDGPFFGRTFRRFKRDATGARLMASKSSLLAALRDCAALEKLPEGSLGRAYLAFCDREGITPGGLVEASDAVPMADGLTEDEKWFIDRMRDSHDLWHVVTGYRTDLGGELSVLTFSLGQTWGPGLTLLVAGGVFETYRSGEAGQYARRLVRDAWRTSRRAAWFPLAPFEEWLARPIDEVRNELGIFAVPVYTPVYVTDVQGTGTTAMGSGMSMGQRINASTKVA